MPKPLHVVYVPGLGDRRIGKQRRAIAGWRWWGVEPELFQMNWGDKEPWAPKFQRLLARIDELNRQGKPVGLVGVSAGASAVINAYGARKNQLVGVVCIAGKINHPETIHKRYYVNNIAFVTSAHQVEQALQTLSAGDRQHILSRFALYDPLVQRRDSLIPGAKNRLSLSIGHRLTIAAQITLGAPGFLRFLKQQVSR